MLTKLQQTFIQIAICGLDILKELHNKKMYIKRLEYKVQKFKEENERLQKDVENLQEVIAELGATLLMNGFEIEINSENLKGLIDDE